MIDETEYSILKAIDTSDQQVWKNEIHRRILEMIETIPGLETISVQTVCRRVDDLYEANYLNSQLKNIDAVNRTLIDVFHLTETGRQVLQEYREHLLRKYLVHHMENELLAEDRTDISEKALRDIFCNFHNISGSAVDHNLTKDCLLSYLQEHFSTGLEESNSNAVSQLEQQIQH